MRFVDGTSVGELVRNAVMPEPVVRVILRDVCLVVKRLHDGKLIHRDIKPDNILVSLVGGSCFLCDFGASLILGSCRRYRSNPQSVSGTLHYMAPEFLDFDTDDGSLYYDEKV